MSAPHVIRMQPRSKSMTAMMMTTTKAGEMRFADVSVGRCSREISMAVHVRRIIMCMHAVPRKAPRSCPCCR
eukprot:1445985-Rhodomonas_salina.1